MNCFEWNNRSSEYLDGLLMGPAKAEADRHLSDCEECTERLGHYRTLLSAISSQPRSTLPVPIRKSPFDASLPRVDGEGAWRARWRAIPWYIRTSLEAGGIVLIILGGITAGPKLRALYERRLESSLLEFGQGMEDAPDPGALAVPLSRGKPVAANDEGDHGFEAGESDDDEEEDEAVEGGDQDSGADDTSTEGDGEVRVGSSEVWRFILKTDSPHEFRQKIVTILTALRVPKDTPGLGGIEAPGGIQFDLLVSQSIVAGLKKQLQAIAPAPPEELSDSPMGETFTWFKNKSKRKVPQGQTRVVIWLSQL